MMRIGITGGIGSGKSFVCSIFKDYNFKIYNSDLEAKNILNKNQNIKRSIISEFGELSYNDNILNAKYISKIIFSNHKKLDKINKIVHPEVFKNYNTFLKKNLNFRTVYESALLFDYDNFKKNDYNILITCPENIRIDRIMTRDNLKLDKVKRKIDSQIDYYEKIDLANFHIENIDKLNTKRTTIEIIEKIILADEKK
jgi:dephospho-CoA kinase